MRVGEDNVALQAGHVPLNLKKCNPGGVFSSPYNADLCYPEAGMATCFTCRLGLKTTHQICFTQSSPRCNQGATGWYLKSSHFHFYVGPIQLWIFKDWGIWLLVEFSPCCFPYATFMFSEEKVLVQRLQVRNRQRWSSVKTQLSPEAAESAVHLPLDLHIGSCKAALTARSWN